MHNTENDETKENNYQIEEYNHENLDFNNNQENNIEYNNKIDVDTNIYIDENNNIICLKNNINNIKNNNNLINIEKNYYINKVNNLEISNKISESNNNNLNILENNFIDKNINIYNYNVQQNNKNIIVSKVPKIIERDNQKIEEKTNINFNNTLFDIFFHNFKNLISFEHFFLLLRKRFFY